MLRSQGNKFSATQKNSVIRGIYFHNLLSKGEFRGAYFDVSGPRSEIQGVNFHVIIQNNLIKFSQTIFNSIARVLRQKEGISGILNHKVARNLFIFLIYEFAEKFIFIFAR